MSLQHILLGLLREQPSSGYDLNKRLEEQGQHFWVTEQSQVYRALYKMLAAGWVVFETVVQETNPNKKIYQLTSTGEVEFLTWLYANLEDGQPAQLWLAQLYLGLDLDETHILDILHARLERLEKRMSWSQEQLQGYSTENRRDILRSLTLKYYIHMLETEMRWLEILLDDLPKRLLVDS